LIFKGEVSRYHPADILTFLCHLGSNGVLSIIHDDQTLTVTLKDGKLVDAHSGRADEKILQIFLFKRFITNDQLIRLKQIRQETGMSVREILDGLKIEMVPAIRDVFETGIKEVLWEFFLLERGEFHFTEVVVDVDPKAPAFDCQAITLEIAVQMDEWREIEKSLFSLESRIYPRTAVADSRGLTDLEKVLIGLAAKNLTAREVIKLTPCSSYEGLKVVGNLYARKLIDLQQPAEQPLQAADESVQDALFVEFKRALKKIVSTGDILKKLSAVTEFCKNYFEQILILTARDLYILQCVIITVKKDGTTQQKTIEHPLRRLDQDQGFYAVYRSGVGFLGKAYESDLLKGLIDSPLSGECAIIPIGTQKDIAIMLYVATGREQHGLNAFHYLELLSWLFNPPVEKPQAQDEAAGSSMAVKGSQTAVVSSPALAATPDLMSRLVDKIEDLPPLPSLVFRILDLLADPEFAMDKLEKLIGQDQSLVAKLIKVSNSVLYGGTGDVHSLREALTRLGMKIVKGLVITTSTRILFPKTNSGMGILSKALWEHSVECGLAAQCVARKIGYSSPEEAFVGGVLHDIGKLVIMLKLPEQYRQIEKTSKSEGTNELDIESQLLGFDHTMIGEKLMNKWGMPTNLKDCVRLHHRFREKEANGLLIPIIAYGNCLSHACSIHAEINQMKHQADMDSLAERFHLTEAQTASLQKEVTEIFQNVDMFD
jgi:HD-like signal output (HDOD) protein